MNSGCCVGGGSWVLVELWLCAARSAALSLRGIITDNKKSQILEISSFTLQESSWCVHQLWQKWRNQKGKMERSFKVAKWQLHAGFRKTIDHCQAQYWGLRPNFKGLKWDLWGLCVAEPVSAEWGHGCPKKCLRGLWVAQEQEWTRLVCAWSHIWQHRVSISCIQYLPKNGQLNISNYSNIPNLYPCPPGCLQVAQYRWEEGEYSWQAIRKVSVLESGAVT